MDIKAEVKVVIKNGEKFLMGPGIFALLSEIGKNTSVSEAAKALNISYSKAWKMIREAEEGAQKPLVIRSTGGRGGGKASLTNDAIRILDCYEKTCRKISKAAEETAQKVFTENTEK